MVCLACLLPIFLVPLVNALPFLVHFILGKIYNLFGWEYRKPERVLPACPYKPSSSKTGQVSNGVEESKPSEPEKVAATAKKED